VQPEAWQALATIVGTIGTATSAVAVAMISRTKAEARKATEAAEQARDNSAPTANGFARRTTAALEELARRSRAHEQRLTWMTDALGQHLTVHHGQPVRRHAWPPQDPDGDDVLFGFGDLGGADFDEGARRHHGPGDTWGIGPS
jgi:hypothetical protein